MSSGIMKVHMSPASTGRLFQRARELKDKVERLQARVAGLQQAAHVRQNLAIEWKVAKDKAEARVAELECMIKVFRGCIDTQILPTQGSPCHKMVWELVGEPDQTGDSDA